MADTNDCDSDRSGALSLQEIKLWSTNALKIYLRVRHKSADGDFDELTAR